MLNQLHIFGVWVDGTMEILVRVCGVAVVVE